MASRPNHQRSDLQKRREAPPEFGARHPVILTNALVNFFGDLDNAWSAVLPEREVVDELDKVHHRPLYRLYDDRERLGITVMEKRLAAEHARNKRLRWNPNDVGRLRGQIENEIGRLGLTNRPFEVELTDVIRVGNPGGKAGERKVATIIDQSSREAELMVREHEIVATGLGVNLRGFQYPYQDYVPHLTVGRVFKEAPHAGVDACVEAVKALLPITVRAEPLTFYAHQEL